MVMIVRSVALGAAIAAASTVLVQAAPLEYNPYTPVELNAPLTASHPAYGAKPNIDCVQPIIPVDPNEAHARSMAVENYVTYRKLRGMEDSAYSDIDDLSSYFGEQLEVGFTVLKEQFPHATAPSTPWPSSYWPTFQDSINHVWKSGEACASEKYAKAYGLDVTDFKDKVSASNGIDSIKNGKSCRTKGDCNGSGECAMRDGASAGICIPSWYGLCHAWAPAALLEQEPKCNVELNGVNFHVFDIKALLTEVYDGAEISTVFTGARFNGPDNAADVDQFGRFTKPARRDLGAGFFHIAISNIMGKHKTSFIMDVAADSEVWNQPVWSYNVQTMEIVDTTEACKKYFGTTSYPFNSGMVHLAYVKTTVTWAVEAYIDGSLVSTGKMGQFAVSNDYEYLLELDADSNIIGGEWVGDSMVDHPDFLWLPTGKPDISIVTSVGLSYADVQELLELSLACNSTTSTSQEASQDGDETTKAPTKAKGDNSGKNDGNNGNGKSGTNAPIPTTEATITPETYSPISTIPTTTNEPTNTPAPTGTEGQTEQTPVPTSPEQQPSTDAPDATTATPIEDTYGTDAPTPAPTGTEGQTEQTPVPTSPEQQPSTDAPDATTATPIEDTYGTDAPTPAPTGTEGQTEQTPVPTSPEQQPSTDAPDATTATPIEDTYGTDAPTPAPTGTEGQTEQTPVPTSPEQQPSTDAPDATTATPIEDTYGTDAPTPAPTGTEGQTEQTPVPTSPEQYIGGGKPSYDGDMYASTNGFSVAHDEGKGVFGPAQVNGEEARFQEQPTFQEHKMCA
ncbi:hypothetical protein PI124_g11965 [Phytophthora idaei]|nr:hypothetical protein PI126_g10483 [Phytophthora idaei]KAG3243218.1 hypothetical protein PI124_g11965 [Phytophthora idaei]